MPIELVTIERIDSTPTAIPDCTRFLITGTTLAFPSECVQYLTVNRLRASLCERAHVTGRSVKATWKDGRYGRELVDVELAS